MASEGTPIRVLTVDDHAILREGIAALIGSQPDMKLVAEAATGAEAIAAHNLHDPDVTLMDLALPDMNGIDAIAAIRKQRPRARFIVLTTFRGDVQALRALKAGATGYLLKGMLRKDLLDTIRVIHQGGKKVPADISNEIATHASLEPLSAREVEVLRWVAEGCSNKSVAVRLSISEDTVKNHMRAILGKLGASDRTHAVTIAIRRGYLDL
jgi:DNA-binding NarL/FixJ family response regulator